MATSTTVPDLTLANSTPTSAPGISIGLGITGATYPSIPDFLVIGYTGLIYGTRTAFVSVPVRWGNEVDRLSLVIMANGNIYDYYTEDDFYGGLAIPLITAIGQNNYATLRKH